MATKSWGVHPPTTISQSEEEYLEAIYRLGGARGEKVRVKDLAKAIGVKDPSVVEMIERLEKKRLVKRSEDGISITKKGKAQAIKTVRRHELAERLLSDVLGYPLDKIHEIACRLEHVMDDEMEERIEKILKNPSSCPHGSPIPSRTGKVKESGLSLDRSENSVCRIVKISEEPEILQRLLSLNLLPGTTIRIVEKLPGGAVAVICGKTKIALSKNIASNIWVAGERHGYRHRGR
ncbi:MAG: metal-dependent transcriptional regulator [Candidatus Hadarchaeales archaeon]